MKAWVCRKSGQPASNPGFKLEDDYPAPVPQGNDVLIKVHAVALNPAGWKTMSLAPFCWLMKRPGVPEPEFSGTIAGGKLEGTSFQVGDEVFGVSPFSFWSGRGTLAEYTTVNPDHVVSKPATLSHAEAAALSVALLTPFWSLVTIGGLKDGVPGQRVFINSGSGGVGVGAVQIAKAYGAYVVSTCSPESRALVVSLGADEVIDYRSVDLVAHLAANYTGPKAFDILCDNVGNIELYRQSPAYLKPDGVYLNIGGAPLQGVADVGNLIWQLLGVVFTPVFLGGTPRKYRFIQTPPAKIRPTLAVAAQLAFTGKVKSVIDSEFQFEDAVKGYERIISGRAKGKVVVHVV